MLFPGQKEILQHHGCSLKINLSTPKLIFGGESFKSKDEFQFWKLDSTPFTSNVIPETTSTSEPTPSESTPSTEPIQNTGGKGKELQFYTRRQTAHKEIGHPILHRLCQDPNPRFDPENSGNSESQSDSISLPYNDLDIPIAQRKGVRSCAQHPISKFVSHGNLSPRYRAFLSNLSQIEIQISVQEARKNPKWRELSMQKFKL